MNKKFKPGDKVKVQGYDEVFIVGDDYNEILRWAFGSDEYKLENNFVTTDGRVFSNSNGEIIYD